MRTTFHCSCNYTFSAQAVRNALTSTSLLRDRLAREIMAMDQAETRIRQKSTSSFEEWMNDLGYELGRLAGSISAWAKDWFGG
jgi:hypothetical protein